MKSPWLRRAAGAVAFVALGGWLVSWLVRSALFPAPTPLRALPDLSPYGARKSMLPSGVEVFHLEPRSESSGHAGPVLVFFHGNGELIDDWLADFEPPRRWGMHVLLVEYPGYGRSAGRPSEKSIAALGHEVWSLVEAHPDLDEGRVVGYGRSLGGGAVGLMHRARPLDALVLESTFTSVADMAAAMGVPRFLVGDRFDTLDAVRREPAPALILHGSEDTLIPPEHGEKLHAALPRSRLKLLPCGHNDCARQWPTIATFLHATGVLPAASR